MTIPDPADGLDDGLRSVASTASEIMGLALFGVSVLALLSRMVSEEWLTVLSAIADAAFADAVWVLPTLVGVIVAFYLALVGQVIARTDAELVLRTRNWVGRASQAVVATTLIYVFLSIGAALRNPAQAPKVLSVLVIGATIALMGAAAGRFAFGSYPERRQLARDKEDSSARVIGQLGGGARWPVLGSLLILLGNLVIPAVAVSLAVQAAVNIRWLAPGWTMTLAVCLGLAAFSAVSMFASAYTVLVDKGGIFSRTLAGVTLLAPLIFVIAIGFSFTAGIPNSGWPLGGLTLLGLLLVAAGTYLPLIPKYRARRNLLAGSALLSLAFHALWRDKTQAAAEGDDLDRRQLARAV